MKTTFTIIDTTKPAKKNQVALDLNGGRWATGRIEQYEYEAKIYPATSEYGIHEGNISKLCIRNTANNEIVAAYDRDWDILPPDALICEMVDALVEFYAQ